MHELALIKSRGNLQVVRLEHALTSVFLLSAHLKIPCVMRFHQRPFPFSLPKKEGRPTISCLRLEVYFELWFKTSYFLLSILKTESDTGSVQNCPHVGFIKSGMPTKKVRVMTKQVFISNETVLQGSNCQIWFPSIHDTQGRIFFDFINIHNGQWCARKQRFI